MVSGGTGAAGGDPLLMRGQREEATLVMNVVRLEGAAIFLRGFGRQFRMIL
jgi:hypothetical protein